MRPLPPAIQNYLQAFLDDHHAPAYLCVQPDLTLLSCGGHLDRYGLQDCVPGAKVNETAYFLEGMLPLDGEPVTVNRVETSSGSFADVHIFPCGGADWVLLLDVSADTAERRQIEEALRLGEMQREQAEKMLAIGRLAGGIAHDFNNLLMVIRGYGELAMTSLQELDEPVRVSILEINKAAERAALLTRQLMAFSRKQVIQPKPADLNGIVLDLEGMLQRMVGEDIQLVSVLSPGVEKVLADKSKIEQVILNLVVNARDAMPSGGLLTIRTAAVRNDHGKPGVVLSVADTGCGMDEETRRHIFEPFYTTKNPEKGTGIGLTTVHGIVSQAGGHIEVESQPGHGSRFDIILPAAVDSAQLDEPLAEPPARIDRSNELPVTVLLVEDEEAIRHLVRRFLGGRGYEVLEARSGRSALSVATGHAARIDLLLTDVVMPDIGGSQLAEQMLTLRPDIKVLFMSGYPDDVMQRQGRFAAGTRILQKPFTRDDLLRSVEEAVSARTGLAAP
jgi:two-component system cell cycle sensor histidine kinase/response regulator CckA